VFRGVAVRRLRRLDGHVQVECQTAAGDPITWLADHVMLALPPRLAVRRIDFDPPLPEGLTRRWHRTETWMAPHAKYVAVYQAPFWREQGLCGAARSSVGPMVEIHDASMPGGHAALFGFLGLSARSRQRLDEAVLRQHCRAQLGRLFGERAAHPKADALKDWAFDPLTATEDDIEASGHHPEAPPPEPDNGVWLGFVQGIGSEWSPRFAGYLAGAVDAAQRGVQRWLGRG
jgi:monoamine oxidase